jgi:uncharacterized protein
MPRTIFPNLAVADLPRAVDFFTKLGFAFNPQFTDESATCMVINDSAMVMLLVRERFGEFTKKPIVDSHQSVEVILAISAESRAEVDAMADKALSSGGAPGNPTQDLGFMYNRSFEDPDGHIWEVFWMDPAHVG